MTSEARYHCHYSIVRFAPFVETGEFANVGVLLICPEFGFLDYRIESRRVARISRFFEPIDADFVRESIRAADYELNRLKRSLGRMEVGQPQLKFGGTNPVEVLFREMIRRREGIVRYSEVRSVKTASPSSEIKRIFEFYVRKSFVTHDYRERVLENEIRSYLKKTDFSEKFRRTELDDGLYRRKFPFVYMQDGSAQKVIKPIYLGQKRPTEIIDHAVKWSTAVDRFKKARKISGEVLFPVEGPSEFSNRSHRAHIDAMRLLEDVGIRTISFQEHSKIGEFATSMLN